MYVHNLAVMQGKLEEELIHLDLGDTRRNTRFESTVKKILDHPGIGIPQSGNSGSDIKMTYDFYNNEQISETAIMNCIQKATVVRCLNEDCVLFIQDTTNISFNSDAEGLGYLDHGMGKGLMVHGTLAVSEQGCPLGILQQHIWARKESEMGKAKFRASRSIKDKESYRWISSMQKTEELLQGCSKIIHIADREADIFELFCEPRKPNSELLIRSTHDRKTLLGNSMWDEIEAEKTIVTFELEMPKTTTEGARKVQMEIKVGMVLLSPPGNKKELLAQQMYGLLVREVGATKDGLEWKLITTVAVDTASVAMTLVRWYSYRWRIERFHYIGSAV